MLKKYHITSLNLVFILGEKFSSKKYHITSTLLERMSFIIKNCDGQLQIVEISMSNSLKDLLTLFISLFFGRGLFFREK